MYIIIQVAGLASRYELDFEDWVDMTIIAGRFQMSAREFVLCVSVVVEEGFRPDGAGVACITLLAIVSVVIVVFEMAGNTGCVHYVVKRILGMTVAAGELAMFS